MTDGLDAARMVDLDALRDFETLPLEETRDWRSLQWYLRGRSDERVRESALRAASREAATLAENIAAHIDDLGGSGGDTVRTIASILEAALAAPEEDTCRRV